MELIDDSYIEYIRELIGKEEIVPVTSGVDSVVYFFDDFVVQYYKKALADVVNSPLEQTNIISRISKYLGIKKELGEKEVQPLRLTNLTNKQQIYYTFRFPQVYTYSCNINEIPISIVEKVEGFNLKNFTDYRQSLDNIDPGILDFFALKSDDAFYIELDIRELVDQEIKLIAQEFSINHQKLLTPYNVTLKIINVDQFSFLEIWITDFLNNIKKTV